MERQFLRRRSAGERGPRRTNGIFALFKMEEREKNVRLCIQAQAAIGVYIVPVKQRYVYHTITLSRNQPQIKCPSSEEFGPTCWAKG